MARARAKQDKNLSEIADVILAEWYRVLPDIGSTAPLTMDSAALTAAFNQILNTPCIAVLDGAGTAADPLKIVVPQPPVRNRQLLDNYIKNNSDFRLGMGAAVIFGCGR
jgi:hypothetical protein